MDAKERLQHLRNLAADGDTEIAQIAGELCAVLLDWPESYPDSMRASFESLLENSVSFLDDFERAALAKTIPSSNSLPLAVLGALYLVAPQPLRDEILTRCAATECETEIVESEFDRAAFITIARAMSSDSHAASFADLFGVPTATAQAILEDPTGQALAVACRGTRLPRAMFSTIALLTADGDQNVQKVRLSAYETVPENAARFLVQHWRQSSDGQAPDRALATSAA